MKRIKVIGFDMDYTIVRYRSELFEEETYQITRKKLIEDFNYPSQINKYSFDFQRAIRGLVLDRELGNILKTSRFGKVKQAFHGLTELDYQSLQTFYRGLSIDLSDNRYVCVDTSFSIAHAVLFAQLVEYRDQNPAKLVKGYYEIEKEIKEAIDIAHRDDSLKNVVKQNLKKFIIQDKKTVEILERYKKHFKKIWIITNSDFDYTKALLDYTINPYLKNHKNWQELFEIVITSAHKPKFFTDEQPLLKIDCKTGLMKNFYKKIEPGVYQGGSAARLQNEFNYSGEDILYIGDHIYGDIVTLKRACNWRTALVVEELAIERSSLIKGSDINKKIKKLMNEKVNLEKEVDQIYSNFFEKKSKGKKTSKSDQNEFLIEKAKAKKIAQPLIDKIKVIDNKLTKHIITYKSYFNPYWGGVMRAGAEGSRISGQIEKYSCIYMSKVADLLTRPAQTYFRPIRMPLPHEVDIKFL